MNPALLRQTGSASFEAFAHLHFQIRTPLPIVTKAPCFLRKYFCAMSSENENGPRISFPEAAASSLNLASLRVDLRVVESLQREVRAELIVHPQVVTAEQATDGLAQEVKLKIGVSELQMLLVLQGGEFDFDPGYTAQVDKSAFTIEEQRHRESSQEGAADASIGLSTPSDMPLVNFNAGAKGSTATRRTISQTESTTRVRYIVEMDTPPPDADPNRVRRWRIGADGEGGDLERGLPYLNGNSYLGREDRPLATFLAQDGANRISVDLALAMRRDALHVEVIDAAPHIDDDVLKIKTRLAQLAINRAIKKIDFSKFEAAVKIDEILINFAHKEINR